MCFPNSYKLRVDSMLLKEEFATDMDYLIPSIESIIVACRGKFFNLLRVLLLQ